LNAGIIRYEIADVNWKRFLAMECKQLLSRKKNDYRGKVNRISSTL
jgi:hypothetical protein